MRKTTRELLHHYLDGLEISGDVLEIGDTSWRSAPLQTFPRLASSISRRATTYRSAGTTSAASGRAAWTPSQSMI